MRLPVIARPKEPHLSPQHYELNAIQNVPVRTRVSVAGDIKDNANQRLGGSRFADLHLIYA